LVQSELKSRRRCFGGSDPMMIAYHDNEWGVAVFDDRLLFEHLVLDMFQAGLSWRVVLNKRESMRRAFDGFDPERIARYRAPDVQRLLADSGMIRNRLKIQAAISNAQAYLRIRDMGVSFSDYLWSFCDGRVLKGPPARRWEQLPTRNGESEAMARDLKAAGFSFAGPTVCYAFMQAVGMIDDHLVGCFKHDGGGRPPA
jgi:DNA-3-methyladenine glycosylase I